MESIGKLIVDSTHLTSYKKLAHNFNNCLEGLGSNPSWEIFFPGETLGADGTNFNTASHAVHAVAKLEKQ